MFLFKKLTPLLISLFILSCSKDVKIFEYDIKSLDNDYFHFEELETINYNYPLSMNSIITDFNLENMNLYSLDFQRKRISRYSIKGDFQSKLINIGNAEIECKMPSLGIYKIATGTIIPDPLNNRIIYLNQANEWQKQINIKKFPLKLVYLGKEFFLGVTKSNIFQKSSCKMVFKTAIMNSSFKPLKVLVKDSLIIQKKNKRGSFGGKIPLFTGSSEKIYMAFLSDSTYEIREYSLHGVLKSKIIKQFMPIWYSQKEIELINTQTYKNFKKQKLSYNQIKKMFISKKEKYAIESMHYDGSKYLWVRTAYPDYPSNHGIFDVYHDGKLVSTVDLKKHLGYDSFQNGILFFKGNRIFYYNENTMKIYKISKN